MKWLLLPFALIYRCVTVVRNWLFDWGMLKSKAYGVPVIVVGNITVGGTGKTPHVEYLANLLASERRVAVVSRGYGRSTSGFVEVSPDSDARSVGDEPLQIKRKFTDVLVAVDEVRTHAIDLILNEKKADTFILDDALQHRHVKAGLNIVLVDYNRPIFSDLMLPAGRLREPRSGIGRANIVLVTKCPKVLNEAEMHEFSRKLDLPHNAPVFFTTFGYGALVPIGNSPSAPAMKDATAVVATGIARPERLYGYLEESGAKVVGLKFPDHHFFSIVDVDKIVTAYKAVTSEKKMVIVTEKDAMRLTQELTNRLAGIPVYYLPIQVEFIAGQAKFDKLVTQFCEAASANQR